MPAPHERLEAWAALSVPANIADGAAKRGPREFRRFLDISLGSLGEVTYLLCVARDLEFLTEDTWCELERLRDHAGKLTWGLYKAVGRKTV